MKRVAKIIRKLRHWKQRFDKNAKFVWRKFVTYDGEQYVPGDDIPEKLAESKTKLRRFWESRWRLTWPRASRGGRTRVQRI